MAKVTPSMAKNQIKRSLLQVIDTHPNKSQKQQVWNYFDNKCAYCDIVIDPNSRKGHLDHLQAVKDGGTNEIYNFVLACNICNGDEKR
ncbi:HNH endonuclease [Psychrobacter faecalis]|nr:HNH endonuclease signature motif containing protein [Psychrobacter faecalis]